MIRHFLRVALCAMVMLGSLPMFAAFKDIKIDLTNGNLLTKEEIADQSITTFGVVIGDNGEATRVAADDPTANIVLSGKFHSNDHGWGNFSCTVAVEGPVKVSMGTCAWGGNVTVKNAANETVATFNTNTGACFHGNKAENIASTYYKGEATTLTISGGSYTPYIGVEAVDPASLIEEVNISYAMGDNAAEGVLPATAKAEVGSTVKLPLNRTLFVEGKTLTGWSDGTTTYLPGAEMEVPATDVTLTPVFTTNSVSLDNRTDAVEVNFDFQQRNGAPVLSYQGKAGIYVTQAVVNGETIDVKTDFTTNPGKLANGSWQDWAQINEGTTFTIPSAKGATVTIEAWGNVENTIKIDGSTDYETGTIITAEVASSAKTIDVVFGNKGSYFRYIKVVLPAPAADAFKDIKLDLTNGNFLTEDEIADKSLVTFGVNIAADGTATRVAANDATANIVLTGKYHSPEHGWGNFSCTARVDGPVKVGMGSCAWGGDVTVKNADNETVATFNTNNGACFHNNKADNIVYALYKGDATTLTISGGSYTPYISIEALDPSELIEDVEVSYSLGDIEAEGELPAAFTAEVGSTITIPVNRTLFVEGKTLTGWSDGTNVYAIGEEMTIPAANVALTPVFTTNSVSLADRTEPVEVLFDFQRKNGAPLLAYEGRDGILVTQALVNGTAIDVKTSFTTTPGKLANGNWNDWAQINQGTTFTIPSAKGAKVCIEAYGDVENTIMIDGQNDYVTGSTIVADVLSSAETIDVVFGNKGSYFRYIKVTLPVVASNPGGQKFENVPAEVVWACNNSATYDQVSSVTPDGGFSVTSLSAGDMTVGNTARRTADNLIPDVIFVKFKPAGVDNAVELFVKPAAGLTFTPTTISFYIQRFGTDAENGVIVTGFDAENNSEVLGTFTAPRANQDTSADRYAGNDNWTNHVVINLTDEQQAQYASGEGFRVTATIGVGNTKEGGFSDFHIAGLLNGELADINKYAVTVAAYPEEGGQVSLYPVAETYDEGTEVKVSATKNFGYNFINWTDADNNVVSEEPVFMLTVDKAYDLTANYAALNTYELNYSVDGGANLYMVQPVPAPTVVEGRNMYEEGTQVSLTAMTNPILSFTNWSDGQTSGEIVLTMDRDIDIVANYTAVDFIAGWDFWMPGASGRPADFKSEDNDAAAIVLRTADGETSGWLDKSQMAAGGYEGRPGAVNWRTTGLGKYYWQTKVNASAFTNIRLITSMVYNYNSYTVYDAEYSLDNETWKAFGSIEMEGAKAWADAELNLPAAANNQENLYIRLIADKESTIDGTTSANDGNCLGATFIVGDRALVDDGTAPVLLSSVPAEGADNASANGKIVLTFDEKVMVADGTTASLNDKKLTPKVVGKVVSFDYKGLAYSTDYRFTLAAGSISDLTGNAITEPIVINFTTRTRPTVTKALYDFVVPDDGSFKEAINIANSRVDKNTRFRIFVKQGDYLLPVNEGKTVESSVGDGKVYADSRTDLVASNVSIIGEGTDNTLITNDCPEALVGGAYPCEGLRKVYTLRNSGSNLYIQDLSLINGMQDNTGRGEAYEESGDKTIMKNVGLRGYQDTYCSNSDNTRHYFEGGYVRGRTDYLCGKDDIFFNGVELRNCEAGGYITAPSAPRKYGYVFRDCRLTADPGRESDLEGRYTLGRPWGQGSPTCIFINTTAEVLPSADGWSEMSGGFPARFAEYNTVTKNGTTVDLSARKKVFASSHTNNPILSADEAEFYTVTNVLGGDDDWDPTAATEQASAPTSLKIANGVLTWDDSEYVLCWAICRDGKVIDFTTEPTYTVDDPDGNYSVRAANEMGGLGEAALPGTTGIDGVNPDDVIETVTYNLQGMRVDSTFRGPVIRVSTLADGSTITVKEMR